MEHIEITCPICLGAGDKVASRGNHSSVFTTVNCGRCGGRGKIDLYDFLQSWLPTPYTCIKWCALAEQKNKSYVEKDQLVVLDKWLLELHTKLRKSMNLVSGVMSIVEPIRIDTTSNPELASAFIKALEENDWSVTNDEGKKVITITPLVKVKLLEHLIQKQPISIMALWGETEGYFKNRNKEVGGGYASIGKSISITLADYEKNFLKFTISLQDVKVEAAV